MKPLYLFAEGAWYVRKDHFAEQLERAIVRAQFDLIAQQSARKTKRNIVQPEAIAT
jgi:hypothetical protein